MKRLLKTIKSGNFEYIYPEIVKTATLWTFAGFIDQANLLLEKLWNTDLEDTGGLRHEYIGLNYFWVLTGKKPGKIKIEEDLDAYEQNNIAELFQNRWALFVVNNIKQKDLSELTGDELMIYGITTAFDTPSSNQLTSKEQQLNALKSLDKFIKQGDNGWELFMSLTCAIILASHNELIEEAKSYITSLGVLLKNDGPEFYNFPVIMPDKYVAPILLTGILAPIFELTEEKCYDNLQKISTALDERLSAGRTNAYSNLSWKKLLKEISGKENKKMILSPATKQEIENAEERLQIKLPKEYKDFLKISNGLKTISDTIPTLLSVDKIGWLKDLDKELVDIWCNPDESDDKEFIESFSKSLLIGGHMEEQQLLLIPSKKSKEWECWLFASWLTGESKYPDFRYYMESLLE